MLDSRTRRLALVLFLVGCGESSTAPASASAVADSAKAPASSSAAAAAPASSSAAPAAAADKPAASPSASASAAPKVASNAPPPPAMDKKSEDDLLKEMMGDDKPAAKPSATPAAGGAVPASELLADAFAGAPDASIKISKTLKLGAYSIDIPDGWDASDNTYDGMVNGSAKDKGTAFVLYSNGSPATEANVTTWLRAPAEVDTDSVKWQPANPFKLGKSSLDGKIAKGTGKAGAKKDDADLTYFLIGDGAIFLSTVTKKSASEKDRAELVACIRSLHK